MKRRDFLGALAAPALVGLACKAPRRIAGNFVDDGGALGHSLRDRRLTVPGGELRRVPVVIVGGGMAGLSAGWELDRRGIRNFVILELEETAGGNARSGENDVSAYPWAAHYVPVPDQSATLVRELFEELGVLRDGVWEERALCFSPQERLFVHGEWHPGIEPDYAITAVERADLLRFDEAMARARSTGEFTIPMASGAQRASPLDRISMSEWLTRERLTSPALRWYVDYACRDDYGALAGHTSAWAGIHYFASRAHVEQGPLTWPEGLGWVAKRLIAKLSRYVRTGEPVVQIEPDGGRWRVSTSRGTYLADAVVFAAPSFLLPHMVPTLPRSRLPLVYSPWLTANLTLDHRPRERARSAPPAWDNAIYDSPALGYVDATHQALRSHQDTTVWTYYWSLAEHTPSAGRQLLLSRSWTEWSELILHDLERAHPDIRSCVTRLDIMRMGHAMVRPAVGFLDATSGLAALERPGFYIAHSDMSGLSLFEEAQSRGVSAARNAMRHLGS